MDVEAFLNDIRSDPEYAGQLVHVREVPGRQGRMDTSGDSLSPEIRALLPRLGLEGLYCHQAETIRLVGSSRDVLVATGTASGKTLCYALPIVEALQAEPQTAALLLFPTKALGQDQFKNFSTLLETAGLEERMAGVFDGDTPAHIRRRLRDRGTVIFTNPDMLHAGIMPQHARWAAFLSRLRFLVLDELHVYSGIFGSNMALLLRRFFRLCAHYGSAPQIVACSATIANPEELGNRLTGRDLCLVDQDGSPRGRKIFVFWNPPRVRASQYRSRRSANVEAHELMARLVARGVATIAFSKAKMTAEMIYRYVCEKLQQTAPHLAARVTPYRGGYLPEERRAIEQRLFSGELVGVSATPALELGIDVGSLEACIIVGYPGKRASFFQQAGRAGRQERDSVVFLVGLDTAVNQYVMDQPGYVFDQGIEQAVIDPDNPFVAIGHLRCAAHEMPLSEEELEIFGPHAEVALRVLETNFKVRQLHGRWYHAAAEIPQHEVSLRRYADENVVIEDAESDEVVGEVNKFDAEPIVHPGAIYMHRGDTYRVLELDLERNIARIRREAVDYYTQPLGGTDIHHIDHCLREKEFGTGRACWGEVTAYFNTGRFEKIHFYSLDAISQHEVDLPTLVLETMAFWIVPPEELMEEVRRAGLDAHSGLRGIGYATRMLLPLFFTCDTLDFSHTVGSANSPWNAIFVYERYPHGLGFTEKAYARLDQIMPAVLSHIARCPCPEGCPCCVGKPLRQATTWNVERGEASVPSKAAARMILEGLLGDGTRLSGDDALPVTGTADELRLEQALRRRLERMREPKVFHPITPARSVRTEYPAAESAEELRKPDVAKRAERRRDFDRDLHRRIARRVAEEKRSSADGRPRPSPRADEARKGTAGSDRRLPDDSAIPSEVDAKSAAEERPADEDGSASPVVLGDALAARARRRLRARRGEKPEDPNRGE